VKTIEKIFFQYSKINTYLLNKENTAKNQKDRDKWAESRKDNDNAYFALFFSQLEDKINELCKDLIAKKKSASNWKRKRAWMVYDQNKIETISFLNKASFLLDKSSVEYQNIQNLYKTRCKIAHGDLQVGINLTADVSNMKDIASKLSRN